MLQERGHWVPNFLPSFAKNLHILVVDHETLSLKHLSSLLRQQSYNVTTTGLGCIALSMIQEKSDQFDLVMANVSMPDMDSFSFLHVLLEMNIAVIFMSSAMNLKVATKALAEGACYFLQKPISKDDLKYVWQHMYRRSINIAKLTHIANCVEKAKSGKESVGIQNDNTVVLSRFTNAASYNNNCSINYQLMSYNGKVQNTPTNSHDSIVVSYFGGNRSTDDIEGTNKEERVTCYSKPTNFGHTRAHEDNGRGKEYFISRNTISCIVWNVERRLKFFDALNKLGDKCRPKLILKLMNEPCLTLRQVANHLQFSDIHQANVAQQLEAMEFNGTSEGIPLMSKNIALPDSTNLDNVSANFVNEESQQQLAEYDYLLNVLEDDPPGFGSDFDLSDIDKYSEWLRNTVLENGSGLDSFINDNAENFRVEINQ